MSNSKKYPGVGKVAKAATLAGATPKEVVKITKTLIPGCCISIDSAYTYRSVLRGEGHNLPS